MQMAKTSMKRAPSDAQIRAELAAIEGNDPPLSAYAAVAAQFGVPAWAMMVPGLTKDMFEDITKMPRLVRLMRDYLDCSDAQRSNTEAMAAGLAELSRGRAAEVTRGN
jgi:hypothetical protein